MAKQCAAAVLGMILLATLCAAAEVDRADPAAIRTAVQKGLALLEKQSPTFVKRGGCNSCHNQYLPVAAHTLARERGIAVGKEIALLPQEAIELTADRILELTAIGGTNGIGYELLAKAALKQPADERTDAFVHYLKANQEADGHWKTTGNRPPLTYDEIQTTVLAMRALQVYTPEAQRAEMQKRIARCVSWLLEAKPESTQERAYHLLGLGWAKAGRPAIEKAVRGLTGTQRADGGWSQIGAMNSDAYATGQALYALAVGGGVTADDSTYRRGVKFLLKTQAADGSWFVRTRSQPFQPYFESGFPYGHDQWISAAGTSWAAMALALAIEPVRLSAR